MRTFYACYRCWQSKKECECAEGYDNPLNHSDTTEYNALTEEERKATLQDD